MTRNKAGEIRGGRRKEDGREREQYYQLIIRDKKTAEETHDGKMADKMVLRSSSTYLRRACGRACVIYANACLLNVRQAIPQPRAFLSWHQKEYKKEMLGGRGL